MDGARCRRTVILPRGRTSNRITEPRAVRPRVPRSPTAERSELRGDLRRVIYGRTKTVRREGCAVRDERVDRGGEDENGSPGDKDGHIGQSTEQRVAAVANLQGFDAASETPRHTGGERRGFQKRAGEDFQRQEEYENDRYRIPTIHMCILVILPSGIVKKCNVFVSGANQTARTRSATSICSCGSLSAPDRSSSAVARGCSAPAAADR